jgi:hypothetical protein
MSWRVRGSGVTVVHSVLPALSPSAPTDPRDASV